MARISIDANATDAYFAARRLHVIATALLVIGTIGAVVGLGLGTAIAVDAKTDSDKTAGVAVLVGSVVGWLQLLLVCFAVQAHARYIEWRTRGGA